MSKPRVFLVFILALALAGALSPAAQEQPAPPQGDKPLRAVVTFDGDLEALPTLAPADFEIEAGKKKFAPARLYRPDEMPTVLAIVLQENQTPDFGTQLDALRDFILSQPPNTYVGIFYLSTQAIETAILFDSNLQKVAEALRAPKGMQDLAPPSPYDGIARLIAGMAQLPDARKEILWFAEGSDATVGDATAGQNPNLARALSVAQKAGIPVWVIFTEATPPVGRVLREEQAGAQTQGSLPPNVMAGGATGTASSPPTTSGASAQSTLTGPGSRLPGWDSFGASGTQPAVQYGVSYLNYLTERSGGKTFSAGKVPTDIRPFLDEFKKLMTQQVVLEYPSEEVLKKVKLQKKLKDVKLLAPKR